MTSKKRFKAKKIFLYCIFITFLLFLIGTFIIINIVTKENVEFDKDKLIAVSTNIMLLDNQGLPLSNVSAYGKPIISINSLKEHTKNAFIAIEDKTFYNHKGFNLKRIAKAMLTNLKNGYAKEGASTISQQTIKNSHLSNEKTFERKIKELFLTIKLEIYKPQTYISLCSHFINDRTNLFCAICLSALHISPRIRKRKI